MLPNIKTYPFQAIKFQGKGIIHQASRVEKNTNREDKSEESHIFYTAISMLRLKTMKQFLKVQKVKKCDPVIVQPAKLSFKYKQGMEAFEDMKDPNNLWNIRLKEFK